MPPRAAAPLSLPLLPLLPLLLSSVGPIKEPSVLQATVHCVRAACGVLPVLSGVLLLLSGVHRRLHVVRHELPHVGVPRVAGWHSGVPGMRHHDVAWR